MNQLPVDVLIDILSWLPVKPLTICSCISKSFLNLTRDPRFAQAHLSRSPSSSLSSPDFLLQGLCPDHHYGKIHFLEQNRQAVDDDDHYTLTDLQFAIPGFNCFQVVRSCHGLLCLATNSSLRNLIYVCNPFTRQYVRLPDPLIRPLHHNPHSKVVGFGFCDKTHEYKVVEVAPSKLFTGVQTDRSKVFVFTLGECWRDKGDVPCAVETLAGVSNKFVNGALHRVGSSPVNVILSFDVGDEVFRVIPFPDQFGRDQRGFCSLKILGGCLLIVNCSSFGNPAEIWVMLDYGVQESWTKCFIWKDSECP
ncbi:hypothetical protein RHMOL_Rhmol04G0068400 [Rhododendron molle]|uniref:Uncharacterized protein n=1 Tax=Rhododendron molle TaxID=49168 RepID=A0ACC0NYY3_RHOML|nr:hypothetical protein RHMOL_Rhmol04G0068400 [Rhododendron molle]